MVRRAPNSSWLTTRQCADFLGVTPRFVVGEIRDSRLSASRIAGTRRRTTYRVSTAAFSAYVTSHWPSLHDAVGTIGTIGIVGTIGTIDR